MKRGRGFVVCIILILIGAVETTSVYGQSHEKKWGHISQKNLEMKVYAPDSSASAVVLFDVGNLTHDMKLDYYMERHVRIKILTDQGFDWATIKIPYDKSVGQHVDRIDGETYYLSSKGKIIKTKLSHKDIYKEKLDKGDEVIKFTLPKVRPGAIIEYRYKKKIGNPLYLDSWTFQHDIPVEWSVLNFRKPSWFNFKLMLRGGRSLDEQSSKPYVQIINLNELGNFGASEPDQAYSLGGTEFHWAIKDLPALKKESHVYDRDFYRSRMLIQYSSLSIKDRNNNEIYHKDILSSWHKIRDQLLDNDAFGHRLKGRDMFKSQLGGILNDKMSQDAKLKAVYDFVKRAIVWNKRDAVFCESKLKDVFEKKNGTSSEINMLLIQMLHEAGIEAYPVVASTRDHGPIINSIPIYSQFNTTLCMAIINNKKYFLDATNPYRPFTQVAERLAGCQGLVIKKPPEQMTDKVEWVKIKERPRNERNVTITGNLSSNGFFKGTIGIRLNGYYGTEYREDLADAKSPREFVKKNLLDHFNNVKIDTVVVLFQKKDELPLMMNIKLTGRIKAVKNGNMYYVNPTLLFRQDSNPFTEKTRTMPIDFSYPRSVRYLLKVKLDSNLTFSSDPKNVVRKMKSGGAIAQYIVQGGKQSLSVFFGLNLSKIQFLPKQYYELKEFYGHVVQDENTKIVLKDN